MPTMFTSGCNNRLNSSYKFAKVWSLFNAINEQFILHVSVEELMVPYFGKHGEKHCIHGKPKKFWFKLWAMATPLEYCIQFHPYTGKDSILQEYENIGLGLGASVVANLVSKLHVMQTSLSCTIILQAQLWWDTWAQRELLQQERSEQAEWKMLYCEIW